MSKWIGYAVSVNCGDPLGCYQGTILEADGTTITLTKAFRNGFPYPKSQVTLNAADIKDLKIIESKAEPAEQTHSTVSVTKNNKKSHRATVCENLQANQTSTGSPAGAGRAPAPVAAPAPAPAPVRSKPIEIQGPRLNRNNNHAGSFGNAGSTPKGRGGGGAGAGSGAGAGAGVGAGAGHEKARRRNEACFGEAAEAALDDDFDFEGNLALFDKRALWERMRGARPDLVRSADDKFRPDESVLGGAPAPGRALRVPAEHRAAGGYVTDGGAPVPAVLPRLRRRLWDGLERLGLLEVSHVLLARAAADVALRLVGGGRRLEPRNAHQAPCAVALAGAHAAGAAGLAAARLLASHGARAAALVAPRAAAAPACAPLRRELAACGPGDVEVARSAAALPSPDVVLLALYDPQLDDSQDQYAEMLQWARGARAAVVALEPPPRGWEHVCARASVVALAPAALPASLGRVYLADVAPPARLFADHGLEYRPPFGASSLLALHPADE